MFQKLVVRLRSVVRHSNEVYFCCTYMVKYNPHKIAYANEKKTADFACASALSAYVKSAWNEFHEFQTSHLLQEEDNGQFGSMDLRSVRSLDVAL